VFLYYTVSKNSTENSTDSNNQADPAPGNRQPNNPVDLENPCDTITLFRFSKLSKEQQRKTTHVTYEEEIYEVRFHDDCSWKDPIISKNTEPRVMHIDAKGKMTRYSQEAKRQKFAIARA